jgi:alpha-galactosidase
MKKAYLFIVLVICSTYLLDCVKSDNQIKLFPKEGKEVSFQNTEIILKFDNKMYCKVFYKKGRKKLSINNAVANENLSVPSHYIMVNGQEVKDFDVDYKNIEFSDIKGDFGIGKRVVLKGIANGPEGMKIEKRLTVELYNDYPNVAVTSAIYKNLDSSKELKIDSVYSETYRLNSTFTGDVSSSFDFWSFQGGSYSRRPDWIVPIVDNFSQENFQGMNSRDYGGGTPVTDLWNRKMGMAVAHIEPVFKPASLPVKIQSDKNVRIGIVIKPENDSLSPQGEYQTIRTMVLVHSGDGCNGLRIYSTLMQKEGLTFNKFSDGAYDALWCGWGYQREFVMDEIYGALPKVKELGFKLAVIDDGWQTKNGDWLPIKEKFPKGVNDMKAFTNKVREMGMLSQLWYVPFDAHPGSNIEKKHPDWFVLDKDGNKCRISWWNSFYLCPAFKEVEDYQVELVRRFIEDWGYDGLKIDGQCLNLVPPCYNPAHNHKSPYESCEKTAAVFRKMFEKAKSLKPGCVIELCPCGTMASFFNMRSNDQPVASDPRSSWQIRHRGKVFKALMGPNTPYFGDHVELSDGGNDFASTMGIGGVIGTKFTWPNPPKSGRGKRILLDAEKEKYWKKYVDIYNKEMISKGEYQNLYDIGYDKPEGHAVKKDGIMYYAFFAKSWNGKIQIRGLDKKTYELYDYENDKSLGKVKGPNPVINQSFENHLLLKCIPIEK